MNKFQANDIQASFYQLIGKVGGVAASAFLPMATRKKKLIDEFLCLIYDHKRLVLILAGSLFYGTVTFQKNYEFSQPPGSYVETCTSFYIFSGPRWLADRIGY